MEQRRRCGSGVAGVAGVANGEASLSEGSQPGVEDSSKAEVSTWKLQRAGAVRCVHVQGTHMCLPMDRGHSFLEILWSVTQARFSGLGHRASPGPLPTLRCPTPV